MELVIDLYAVLKDGSTKMLVLIGIVFIMLAIVFNQYISLGDTTSYVVGRVMLPYDIGSLISQQCKNENLIGRVLITRDC